MVSCEENQSTRKRELRESLNRLKEQIANQLLQNDICPNCMRYKLSEDGECGYCIYRNTDSLYFDPTKHCFRCRHKEKKK